MNERANVILHFWFNESSPNDWFTNNINFDKKIRQKFMQDYNKAINNKYDKWQDVAKECLALIIILDQFSRNLFRNNSKAFSMDKKACIISKKAINQNYLKKLSQNEILFLILPLIHSENLNNHTQHHNLLDVYLMKHPEYGQMKKFAKIHTNIIKRFKRYPYRNKVLGRETTKQEKQYLSSTHYKFFNI